MSDLGEKKYGPSWTLLLERYLDGETEKTFGSEVYHFENEVKTTRYIHGTPVIRETAIKWMDMLKVTRESCENLSKVMRELGNSCFKKSGKARSAAIFYTEAIFKAPPNSQAQCLAHANRAAALYKLERYEAAYFDCECAISLDYPRMDMILMRQATCARSLRDSSKLEACLVQLEALNLDDEFGVMKDFRRDLLHMEPCREKNPDSVAANNQAEKKQKVMRSTSRGRYVVAGETIEPGEQIMSEEAIAFIPVNDTEEDDDETIYYVCHNCAENDIVPFPCSSCRCVSYCSPRCRNQHNPIHSIECEGYKKSLFRQIGIAHLAFRALLVGFDEMLDDLAKIRAEGKKYTNAEELWCDLVQTAKDGNLMGLCTNLESMDNSVDLIRYALTASMLCCYLDARTNFFKRNEKKRHKFLVRDSEWEIIVAALLLRLSCQMICNGHSIPGLTISKPFSGRSFESGEMASSFKPGTLFAAIYPRVSLYNHSCEASFRNRYEYTKLLLISNKSLGEGDEIYNNYGNYGTRFSRNNRRKLLKEQYSFTCSCVQCVDANDREYEKCHTVICKTKHCRQACVAEPGTESSCPRCLRVLDDGIYTTAIECTVGMDESVHMFMTLCDDYKRNMKNFGPHNLWLDIHSSCILNRFLEAENLQVKMSDELNGEMIKLAVGLSKSLEERYGIFDFIFLHAGMSLLDLVALRKRFNFKRIVIDYDLNKIRQSIDVMLMGKMKKKCEMFCDRCV